jgi:transcriptional regulator with XRE-family HTH domain
MYFSNLLIEYRKKLGLKKNEVAKILNWTPMYYGRFENNQLYPTKKNIAIFSKLLGIPESDLIKYIPVKNK